MRTVILIVLAGALLTTTLPAEQSSTRAAPHSPFKLVASVGQVMTAITVPASDVIFESVADIGKKDMAWQNIQNNALTLAESGNLLMLPGRAPDNDEWVKESQAMIDAAMMAFHAAEASNADQLSDAGDKIYATCESCHKKYMNK